MKDLKSLNKYLWRYRGRLTLGFIFVALSNAFAVLQPRMISQALDLVLQDIKSIEMAEGFESQALISSNLSSSLLSYGLLVIGFALLMGIFMYFTRQTIIVVSRLIEYDLRKDIYDHYSKLSQNFYRKSKIGDLMNRIMEDVSKVRMYLGPAILYGINLTTLTVLVVSFMVSVSSELSLYTLIPLPLLSVSIYYVSSIVHKRSTKIQQQLSLLTSLAQEVYSGIRVVKSFVKGKQMGNYFTDQCDDYKSKSMELVKVNAFFFPLMMLIIGISTIFVIYFGGLQINKGNISAGTLVEFIIYVNMLTWPVTSIGWIASIVQQAAASQRRIDEFFNQKPQILNGNITDFEFEESIEFKNVSFVYPDTGIKALENISFTIKKGDRIAIIGKTGSGKTTIAEIILRTFDPSEGEVLIDGKPLESLDLLHWRTLIGYVPQDNFLFSDTIENNIKFGQNDATLDEVMEAATKASIHKEIAELPSAYQTAVGERGVTLSGGQKQRTSIARAIIKDPEIIILDDALSAVDANTEQVVTNYLDQDLKGKTVFNITHRINPNSEYDQIIILQKGHISAIGKHEVLYHSNSFYKHLIDHAALENLE
ncbi:ABC transporter ATP-binding protein [Membranihabitans maritimus]|uniref:ABC transporter ATP-binding protein n=1 Tax=Membranihabitans maritimus TaxID=2904244 RepID=UPI001F20B5B6|nr:ABC transporter ATP-binding protein [Membranihabitans maritimus]